jgi:hypothetical protein
LSGGVRASQSVGDARLPERWPIPHGLLERPSELTVCSAEAAVRPLNTRPSDPRHAD